MFHQITLGLRPLTDRYGDHVLKVFISHSSHDKWVARQVSALLEADGITTFLDAKDIESGESIDTSIQDNLSSSDEMLIVVSPASLGSPWVLIEIGGAKALKKRIVPLLLHVGPNELPGPIAGLLARDINDLDRYRAELRLRAESAENSSTKGSQPRTTRVELPSGESASRERTSNPPMLKVGDRVKIIDRKPPKDNAEFLVLGWNMEMDEYLGRVGTITRLVPADGPGDLPAVRLDVDDQQWYWGFTWLTPAYDAGVYDEILRKLDKIRDDIDG